MSSCFANSNRRSRQLELRADRRRLARARKKEAEKSARAAVRASLCSNGPATAAELRARWELTAERQRAKAERERVKNVMRIPWYEPAAGLRVAIDLGMEDLMVSCEITSLASQITNSYAQVLKRCAARSSWYPLRLALTGIEDAPETMRRIRSSASDLDRWPVASVLAEFSQAVPAMCAPARPQLVVLSPDAEKPLLELSTNCVYVIGGLCDYRRIANATRDRAAARQLCCRRLPLRETFHTKLSVEILTVDQVVVALLEFTNNGGDWVKAFDHALPQRKLRRVLPTSSDVDSDTALGEWRKVEQHEQDICGSQPKEGGCSEANSRMAAQRHSDGTGGAMAARNPENQQGVVALLSKLIRCLFC
mmetsp:Transcript_62573/g.104148  ORF Transcript_62573/g.104148 Transcript_62573/m.104148 type:complete len:365 (-) Transcript_62573:191-1285(-)